MRCSSLDRYSFRPYFTDDGRILYKLTVLWNAEYVLVPGPRGHYEEFADLADPLKLAHLAVCARSGILGGHRPFSARPMRTHSGKSFPKTVMVAGKGRKFLVQSGTGITDRVISIGPAGFSTGLSYVVAHEDISDEQPTTI
jgi:hypothetical protein